MNNNHLQDEILSKFKLEHVEVNIYLVNGVRLAGAIIDYDDFTVRLEGISEQLIYKHAISTIMPR